MAAGRDEKDIVWLGDSLALLRKFPKTARIALGSDLRRLQLGELPIGSKPMKIVGRGVRELRARDHNNQYWAIYVARMAAKIVVLHSFMKKSRTTSRTDMVIARERLKAFDRR